VVVSIGQIGRTGRVIWVMGYLVSAHISSVQTPSPIDNIWAMMVVGRLSELFYRVAQKK